MKSDWQTQLSQLLLRWNARINLVGKADIENIARRHIADSLQLVPLIPPHADHGIDLGSGAGFPGLVLAKETGLPFDLVESDRRKAAFLSEAGRIINAPVTVHAVRIEHAAIPPAPLVTARALAALTRLLDLAAPLLAPGGACLFPKGISCCSELTEATRRWHMTVEKFPSQTETGSTILRITELRRAIDPT